MKQILLACPCEASVVYYPCIFISQDCHIVVHAFTLKAACHVQKKADQSMISPHDAIKVFIFILKRMWPFPM